MGEELQVVLNFIYFRIVWLSLPKTWTTYMLAKNKDHLFGGEGMEKKNDLPDIFFIRKHFIMI